MCNMRNFTRTFAIAAFMLMVARVTSDIQLNITDVDDGGDDDDVAFLQCCDGKQYNPRSHICCSSQIYQLPETYNFHLRWKCCGNIMYDSEINVCCDSNSDHILPKADLAPNTGCCGPMKYNNKKDVCCIESNKQDFKFSYYVVHNLSDVAVFCCGHVTYIEGICCSGRLYHKNEYLQICAEDDCICCGKSIASRSTHICCNYILYPRYSADDKCCGSTIYNSHSGEKMCCQGNLLQGYHPDSAACCGKQIYLRDQDNCCNQKIFPKNSSLITGNECCNSNNDLQDRDNDMHVCKLPPNGSEISVQYFKINGREKKPDEYRFTS